MSQTHDYTRRRWGHNFEIISVKDKGQKLRAAGWGRGIKTDDYMILPGDKDGTTTRYQVAEIEYQFDPIDMWLADLTFAPRVTP